MNLRTEVVITPSLPLSVSCSRAFAMVSMIVWRRHDLFRTLKFQLPILHNYQLYDYPFIRKKSTQEIR